MSVTQQRADGHGHETEIEVLPALGEMLEAQVRGEIDVQITTAKRYPRSITQFIEEATAMATLNEEIAAACIYAKPQDGGVVEGPSARLAEICASAWGNMRIEARQVGEDDRFVTARGTSWDLQRNVAIAFEVKRRITKRGGAKYSDDMIGTTSNAAASIALRNAVFKNIPTAFWRPIYQRCREVAVGKASTLASTRQKMIEFFQKLGVLPDRIFTIFQIKGIEDITLDHVATLRGLASAIREGETTVDDAFPSTTAPGAKPAVDPLTQIMHELQCSAETGQAIVAGFDALKLAPAARTVQLKKHQGTAGELLALLREMSGDALPVATTGDVATTAVSATETAPVASASSHAATPKTPVTSASTPAPTAGGLNWGF